MSFHRDSLSTYENSLIIEFNNTEICNEYCSRSSIILCILWVFNLCCFNYKTTRYVLKISRRNNFILLLNLSQAQSAIMCLTNRDFLKSSHPNICRCQITTVLQCNISLVNFMPIKSCNQVCILDDSQ